MGHHTPEKRLESSERMKRRWEMLREEMIAYSKLGGESYRGDDIGSETVWNERVWVKVGNHPLFPDRTWVRKSNLIMAEHLGRMLAKNEIVHHRNENKTDDRIENLEVMDNKDHAVHHNNDEVTRKLKSVLMRKWWSKKKEREGDGFRASD